jgi:hypothetical protein
VATRPPNKLSSRYYRYYLFAEGELWKIPDRLHQALIRGEATLPQYSSSGQKILEVEISKAPRVRVMNIRGTVYSFDNAGVLDLSVHAEAASLGLESTVPVKISGVVDIKPLLRKRYWQRTRVWAPTDAVKALIKNDIEWPKHLAPIRPLKPD